MSSSANHVYVAIAEITHALATTGISKDRKNDTQGYKFRGIDDVLNALSGLLAAHKLCIIPKVVERECEERKTAKGSIVFYVTVKVDFYLVSAVDGSTHMASTYGEAMDSGDKATNKAMSAAYKYMALLLFCIPTEGENDADATTHTVAAKPAEPMATEDQVIALRDYATAEGLEPKFAKRLTELLTMARKGTLTAAVAAKAISTLEGK